MIDDDENAVKVLEGNYDGGKGKLDAREALPQSLANSGLDASGRLAKIN